eukprot:GSChrysophyteH1.ASY1.ANO1.3269.1 assembled CDS
MIAPDDPEGKGVAFHQIARVLRLVENRRCADCSAVLGDGKSTYAQLEFQVWICKRCAECHNMHVSSEGLVLAMSRWTQSNFDAMIRAGSNVKRNQLLERFHNGLIKPQPGAATDERELWIRCKYKHMLCIPAMSEAESSAQTLGSIQIVEHSNDKVGANGASSAPKKPPKPVQAYETTTKKVLPMRLVDYFLTLGAAPYTEPAISRSQGMHGATPLSADKNSGSQRVLTPLPPRCEGMQLQARVEDCFPDTGAYTDASIPEASAPFIFPSGLYLSCDDKPPSIFTFVLTDASRVKIFGAALLFYEPLDPEAVLRLVTPVPRGNDRFSYKQALEQRKQELADAKSGWDIVYAPRALALVGHYPFFASFIEFLKDIYRTSLSSAPVPIERFVNSFVVEAPLPPLGRIEVRVALASRILSIARPPINKLPMVDFSYRPLFTCLSVDTVITTFRMMCAEYSICFVSNNLALLTPVQEALLSFLFPLVWQGVYIPILPKHMMEILDAPVPLITGILESYIKDTPMHKRPASVLFVDIDNDTLHLGGTKLTDYPFPELSDLFDESGFNDSLNEIIQFLQEPSPKMFTKLRQKLVEFGGCVYQSKIGTELLERSSLAFPDNEHLTPLTTFVMEAGIANDLRHSAGARSAIQAATLSVCMQEQSEHGKRPSRTSILSPSNNTANKLEEKWSIVDVFDASELRSAFLRFFVALFIEVDRSSELISKALSEAPIKRQSVKSVGSTAGSLAAGIEPFYLDLLRTQMYNEFKNEREFNSDMPEIRYFNESIAAKKNRSHFTFSTQSTPFLDSKTGEVTEAYTLPTPSVSGLSVGQSFEYSRWPRLNKDNIGPQRPARVLLKGGAETLRKANKLHNASRYGILKLSTESAHADDPSKKNGMRTMEENLPSLDDICNAGEQRYLRVCSFLSRLQAIMRMKVQRKNFISMKKAAILVQSIFRALHSSKKVGEMRVLLQLKEQIMHIVRIQSIMRGCAARCRYRKIYNLAVWAQSIVRAGDLRAQYLKTKTRFTLFSALCRGYLARLLDEKRRDDMFSNYRRHLLLLWKLERTSLYYRSLFWVMVRLPSYLNLAILRDEIFRIYKSVGLWNHRNVASARMRLSITRENSVRMNSWRRGTVIDGLLERANEAHVIKTIPTVNSIQMIDLVQRSSIWKMVEAQEGTSSGSDKISEVLGEKFSQLLRKNIARDKADRESLYKTMKQVISKDDLLEYFALFGVSVDTPRKKDTIVYQLLFNDNSNALQLSSAGALQIIDASASLLVHVHHGKDGRSKDLTVSGGSFGSWLKGNIGGSRDSIRSRGSMLNPNDSLENSSALEEWFQVKKAERVRAASLETLNVCLRIIADWKNKSSDQRKGMI